MYPPVDPETFRWPNTTSRPDPVSRRRPPRHVQGQAFLKGPVPMSWLTCAARQPGKALHVGIALWFLAGLTKTAEVKLAQSLLAQLGVDRHAGYRGLRALETAGLVGVVRHRGRHPVVTLQEVQDL